MPAHKKPIQQHILEGTFRKDRHGENIGGFETLTKAPPCPPSIISKKAIAAWNEIVPILASSGRLAPEDIPGLELAFRNLGFGIAIADTLQDMDPVEKASQFRMLASTMDRMNGFFIDVLSRFGFSSKGREALAQTFATANVKKKVPLDKAMTQ